MQHRRFLFLISSVMVAGFSPAGSAHAQLLEPALPCAFPRPPELDPPAVAGEAHLAMCPPAPARVDAPANDARARQALARARALVEEGRHEAAILSLRMVGQAEPTLADRLALEEADARMAAGPDRAACEAYARAAASPHRAVALRAELGRTRCLLATGDRAGIAALDALRRTYPELTVESELRFLAARAQELAGDRAEAVRGYRELDLMEPGSSWAGRARDRLDALRAEGVEVRGWTQLQEVERAERLLRTGPMDAARAEIARLRAAPLSRTLAAQVARAAARIARVEGRFEEAARLLREGAAPVDLPAEEREAIAERLREMEGAQAGLEQATARDRLRGLLRGRSIDRQPTARAVAALRIAARAGLSETVDEALASLLRRDRMPPGVLFDAGVTAAGVGSDARVAEVFERASRHPTLGVAARYHRARALERLGQREAARAEYRRVVADDSRSLPFYAMFARQRLRAIPQPIVVAAPSAPLAVMPAEIECGVGPFTRVPEDAAGKALEDAALCAPGASDLVLSFVGGVPADAVADLAQAPAPPRADEEPLALPSDERTFVPLSSEEIVALLEPVAAAHGDGYPFVARAIALVRLGEREAATDELHEAFIAWREASGEGALRADLPGVLRGAIPPRQRVNASVWRARRQLTGDARLALARASASLGDHGLAIRFSRSFAITGARPRPYADEVAAAAARHGIEPELLYAVMRVESVYNPRIISYAGAIGLMQIMPRTGRLIAAAMGREDFTVDQLLDPATNIDFAAWYLASLIERFDGRVPLAIASYNGGPHNVRRWMHSHNPDMPLDAFLERIEFSQTHRYVRRVLTHYEAYRAQRGEAMAALDLTLPTLGADRVAF